ncbi:MAG: NYN domain-containing protein [Patescibacteria group bacterium]
MSQPSENNYAFIDSQNLNLAIRDQGWRLDFQRFRVYLSEKYSITKAYLFIGYIPGNESLYARLQRYGYICIFKPTQESTDGKIKGNVDAELVLHTMIEYQSFNRAVIVTGDGDFHCLVEYLRNTHKLLKVLIPNQHKYSALLKKLSTPERNLFDFMNPLRKNLELKGK